MIDHRMLIPIEKALRWRSKNAGDMEGKPCTTGHTEYRDGCVPNDGEHDERQAHKPDNRSMRLALPTADDLLHAHDTVNSNYYDLIRSIDDKITVSENGGVNANNSTRVKVKFTVGEDIGKKMTTTKERAISFIKSLNSIDDNFRTPEISDTLSELDNKGNTALSKILIDKWADTSGDHDVLARSLQLRAAKLFGMKNYFMPMSDVEKSKELQSEKYTEKFGDVLDDYLQASYQNTQEFLKASGIEHLILYRGMGESSIDRKQEFVQDRKVTSEKMLLQPMSSFSTNFREAGRFAAEGSLTDAVGRLIAVKVPIDRVFSTAITGAGCLTESELVVLGGNVDCYKMDFDRSVYSQIRGGLEKEFVEKTSRIGK